MYTAPEGFEIPREVEEFLKDSEELGVVQDLENWYVTPEWSQKFEMHLEQLKRLADSGEPWSQYHLGNMYFIGYLHSSSEDFEKNYMDEIERGSKYLEMAARQGFVAAVDNLVGMGVGPESDRLREIARKVREEHPEFIQKWSKDERLPVIMPSFYEEVWERAYGKTANNAPKPTQ